MTSNSDIGVANRHFRRTTPGDGPQFFSIALSYAKDVKINFVVLQ